MKIAYCSDLHLEFNNTNPKGMIVDADVLVLAGDICEARHAKKNHMHFFKWLCQKYKHVIYVAGNHEHYRTEFRKAKALLRDLASDLPNLYFLERDTVTIEGVKFAGCTLWSYIPPAQEWFAQQRMNDYKLISNKRSSGYGKLHPHHTVFDHSQSVVWLKSLDDVDVVITHHAPSFQSIHPRYIHDDLNCCYSSDLDAILAGKKLWIHGHIHHKHDYIQNGCRVVCNPHGYYGHESNLVDNFKVEIADI